MTLASYFINKVLTEKELKEDNLKSEKKLKQIKRTLLLKYHNNTRNNEEKFKDIESHISLLEKRIKYLEQKEVMTLKKFLSK